MRKESVLDKRLRELHRELDSVSRDLRNCARSTGRLGQRVDPAGEPARLARTLWAGRSADDAPPPEAFPPGENVDHRLLSYLESRGFGEEKLLGAERRRQRNRAIVAILFALIGILWLIAAVVQG